MVATGRKINKREGPPPFNISGCITLSPRYWLYLCGALFGDAFSGNDFDSCAIGEFINTIGDDFGICCEPTFNNDLLAILHPHGHIVFADFIIITQYPNIVTSLPICSAAVGITTAFCSVSTCIFTLTN